MIKVSDYIIEKLVKFGIKDVFMIAGGGAMHLNDSVGRNKNIRYICNHHEQASAMAAEGYARMSGKLAVVIVTSGPGGTNTITGVIGQWLDSVPVLYLSGQVKQETTIDTCPGLSLRQLGDQEINIVDIVRPITKYADRITNPLDTKSYLEKAIYLATHGRPGPVWLDITLDIQGAMVDENLMESYIPSAENVEPNKLKSEATATLELLLNSKRPVIIAGHGIRISGAKDCFYNLIPKLGIPVLSTFNGFDLIDTENPLFMGRIGTIGNRSGNFVLQNCDFLLSLGSRNNIRQIGYNWRSYAPRATKVIVDIDKAELAKPTVKPDLAINADVKKFLEELAQISRIGILPDWDEWTKWCEERKRKYPSVPSGIYNDGPVNPYFFSRTVTETIGKNMVVVAGNGTACVTLFQAGVVKKGQRYIWNSGCASMGYDLPAAIGACLANENEGVVCLAGDGSIQMNLQELQTVVHYGLPIKIFVLNNDGYSSIRQTQDNLFCGYRVACDKSCGISFPDMRKIADAYGIPFIIIENNVDLNQKIENVLKMTGPVICDVRIDPQCKFTPKAASEKLPDGTIISKPLEDMYPFLDRNEFNSNMLPNQRTVSSDE